MAELTANCCSPAAQETCCEPADKPACCDTAAAGGSCGCAAGQTTVSPDELRETVRERYAALATQSSGCCDGSSLGCGNPTAIAELEPGMTVLDLGSGGGIDVLLSARRVAPNGTAYGLDMTDEMLDLARANQAKAGVENVHWLKGHIEDIPLPNESVDVVLSNCVINLSADKPRVLREAARVLKPGGRFAVADVVADTEMDATTRADLAAYVGCVAGALTGAEYSRYLSDAGLTDIEITEAHRVHTNAASAIVCARKA